MEQFNDISKHIEKAQGDKARFLESKKGLLPHFEFPEGEAKQEKHFSKETLLADMYEERIEGAKEMMQNPILLENAYRKLQNTATRGSQKEGENTDGAYWAFHAISALISTHSLSRLSPEKQDEVNSYLENPTLFKNAYRELQRYATRGSQKEGENTDSAYWAFHAISALISTHSLSRLSPEQQNKINAYIESSILLENAYRELQYRATHGSQKEGENTDSAYWAFQILFSLITTHSLSSLSPEKQNTINIYLENQILLENVYRDLEYNAAQSSQKEGEHATHAFWAFHAFSSLITVKDYLRARGKKIDDEKFAKEALNPKKNIPPRPEKRGY